MIQSSPDLSAVDFTLDNAVLVEEVAYGESSGFVEAPEGAAVKLKIKSDLSVLPIFEKSFEIITNTVTSHFLIGSERAYDIVSITESFPKDTGGNVTFRAVNMSPSETSVDVYVLVRGTEAGDVDPVYSALAYKSVADYVQFDPGLYSIVYTRAGTLKEVRVVEGYQFQANRGYTHLLLDKFEGGTPLTSRIIEDF